MYKPHKSYRERCRENLRVTVFTQCFLAQILIFIPIFEWVILVWAFTGLLIYLWGGVLESKELDRNEN